MKCLGPPLEDELDLVVHHDLRHRIVPPRSVKRGTGKRAETAPQMGSNLRHKEPQMALRSHSVAVLPINFMHLLYKPHFLNVHLNPGEFENKMQKMLTARGTLA